MTDKAASPVLSPWRRHSWGYRSDFYRITRYARDHWVLRVGCDDIDTFYRLADAKAAAEAHVARRDITDCPS